MPYVIHRGRRLTNASRLMCTGLPIRGGRVIDRVVGGIVKNCTHTREGDREGGARVHKRRCWKEEDRPGIERRTGTRLHDSPYPDNYRATGMPVCNRALRTNTNAASLASLLLGRTTRSSRPTVALHRTSREKDRERKRGKTPERSRSNILLAIFIKLGDTEHKFRSLCSLTWPDTRV